MDTLAASDPRPMAMLGAAAALVSVALVACHPEAPLPARPAAQAPRADDGKEARTKTTKVVSTTRSGFAPSPALGSYATVSVLDSKVLVGMEQAIVIWTEGGTRVVENVGCKRSVLSGRSLWCWVSETNLHVRPTATLAVSNDDGEIWHLAGTAAMDSLGAVVPSTVIPDAHGGVWMVTERTSDVWHLVLDGDELVASRHYLTEPAYSPVLFVATDRVCVGSESLGVACHSLIEPAIDRPRGPKVISGSNVIGGPWWAITVESVPLVSRDSGETWSTLPISRAGGGVAAYHGGMYTLTQQRNGDPLEMVQLSDDATILRRMTLDERRHPLTADGRDAAFSGNGRRFALACGDGVFFYDDGKEREILGPSHPSPH